MKLPAWFLLSLTPGISISVSLAAMILTIGAVVFEFAGAQDRNQQTLDRSIIRSANKDALAALGGLLEITAYFDAVYDKIDNDPKWNEANLGPFYYEVNGVSAVFGLNEDDRFIYKYVAPTQQTPPGLFELSPAIMRLVHDARLQTENPPKHVANFVRVGEKIYLATAARIVPNDERENAPLERNYVLVFLLEFDSSKIAKVETDFNLTGVALQLGRPASDLAQLEITDALGQQVALLTWSARKPGAEFAMNVMPFILIAIVGIGIVLRLALANWVKTSSRLERARREAADLREETLEKSRENELMKMRVQFSEAKAFETIGHFSGGIAHDFNNVLAAIRAFAEVIVMDSGQSTKSGLAAQRIVGASARGAEMTANILEFATALHVKTTDFEFSTMFDQAVGLLTNQQHSNITFQCVNDAVGVAVHGNETQFVRLLLNLGTNAVKAMGGRTGVVRLTASHWTEAPGQPPLDVRIASIQNSVSTDDQGFSRIGFGAVGNVRPSLCISVADEGHGVDPKILDRIFEPFVSTKVSTMRTGFGLAIVKNIVLAAGGALEVETKQGVGTTFTIWLPTVPRALATIENPDTAVDPRGQERVLIVDDDVDVADSTAAALESYGYRTVAVFHPLEALELFRSAPESWDIAIIDHAMPEMSGDFLAEAMLRIRPGFPIIIYTGRAMQRVAERAREIGLWAILPKPIDHLRMAREIKRACGAGSAASVGRRVVKA